MKKKFFLAVVLILLVIMPVFVLAANWQVGKQRYAVGTNEVVNGDLYIVSLEAVLDGKVNGDVAAVSALVEGLGQIEGDLNTCGAVVYYNGLVKDNLKVAGGIVFINGQIERNLTIEGGVVVIGKDAKINGDIRGDAGFLSIGGEMSNVNVNVHSLRINENAKINGDLTYTSKKEADINTNAKISGKVDHKLPGGGEGQISKIERVGNSLLGSAGSAAKDRSLTFIQRTIIKFKTIIWALTFLSTFLMACLFIYVFKVAGRELNIKWKKKFWKNLLWGFIISIISPILLLLSFATIIGIPLGFGLMMFYIVLLYLSKIVGIVVLGMLVRNLWNKDKHPNWLAALIGTLIYSMLVLIPYAGRLIAIIIMLVGLGALMQYVWNLWREMRKRELA